MELDKIKQKAVKLEIQNTKFNSYTSGEFTFRRDKVYVYKKNDKNFDQLLELSVYSPYIDCYVYDAANELFYNHKNLRDGMKEQENVVVVKVSQEVKPIVIEFDKDNDLFDNIIEDKHKYHVDKEIDVVIAKSKLTDEKIKDLQNRFQAITSVSKKSDIVAMIAEIDGRDEDVISQSNKPELFKELQDLMLSLSKVE